MTRNPWRNGILSLVLGGAGFQAFAGPPFRTDDPQPVDPGHLEVYVFGSGQKAGGDSTGVGPALELNYGIRADTQIHLVLPHAYHRSPGLPGEGGLGDTEMGIKYRFIQETGTRPQIGVFPLVELPTGSAAKGTGSGHTQVYLPVWIQKGWGPWTTYGGYGWWRNPGSGQRNWTYAGWLVQRDLGETLSLGLEAFRTSAMTAGGRASTGFNGGGQVNLSGKHHLLFSAGHTLAGQGQSFFYVGYQLTTGTFAGLRDGLHGGPGHP